jgi:hypothetical protein
MAQDAAPIRRINLDYLRLRNDAKDRTRKVVAYKRLEVSVAQAAPGDERIKPLGRRSKYGSFYCILANIDDHGNSAV